jgi:hypothetical protein
MSIGSDATDLDHHSDGVDPRHPRPGAPTGPTFAEWIADRPQRSVPHVDFGTRWIDARMPGRVHRVSWIPTTGELYATDAEETYVRVLERRTDRGDIDGMLAGWAEECAGRAWLSWVTYRIDEWHRLELDHVGNDLEPARDPDTDATALLDAETSTGIKQARLAEWEADLSAWQQRLDERDDALAFPYSVKPRWSLPAAPVTRALHELLPDSVFSTAEIETFARGCGLDPDLAESLFTSHVAELDIGQIAQVCEALHCSPYDMWGTEQARSILHTFGPEGWPRHIEPLNEGRQPEGPSDFVLRRLDARAAEIADPIIAALNRGLTDKNSTPGDPPETTLLATCFQRTGILALDPAGQVTEMTDGNRPPENAVEYHFSFRQAAETIPIHVAVTPSELASGPLPGFDSIPVLRDSAEQLRNQPRLCSIDLVRFTHPDTATEHWLGWDTEADSWQTWDDPRRDYPGDPSDVLDRDGFTDHVPANASTSVNTLEKGAATTASGDRQRHIANGLEGGRDVGPIDWDDDDSYDDALDAYHAWLAGDRPDDEPESPDGHTLEL